MAVETKLEDDGKLTWASVFSSNTDFKVESCFEDKHKRKKKLKFGEALILCEYVWMIYKGT